MAYPIQSSAPGRRLAPAFAFDDGLVVDCGAARGLVLVNSSGRFIWERFARGCNAADIARALSETYGMAPSEAREIVAQARDGWSAAGATRRPDAGPVTHRSNWPEMPDAQDGSETGVTRTYRLGPRPVSVTFDPPRLETILAGRIGHTVDPGAVPVGDLRLSRRGRRYVLSEGATVLAASRRVDVVTGELTRRLLELATGRSNWLAVLHAAALSMPGGTTIALPAIGGTGKSTLALALANSGYSYFSDDCVPIDGDGMVVPAPYAICIKEGNLAAPSGLPTKPAPSRQGGHCRYLVPNRIATAPAPLDVIVFLERVRQEDADASRTGLWPIVPTEALSRLFAQRAWVTREIDGLTTFLTMMETIPAYRLVYRTTDEAIALLAERVVLPISGRTDQTRRPSTG